MIRGNNINKFLRGCSDHRDQLFCLFELKKLPRPYGWSLGWKRFLIKGYIFHVQFGRKNKIPLLRKTSTGSQNSYLQLSHSECNYKKPFGENILPVHCLFRPTSTPPTEVDTACMFGTNTSPWLSPPTPYFSHEFLVSVWLTKTQVSGNSLGKILS